MDTNQLETTLRKIIKEEIKEEIQNSEERITKNLGGEIQESEERLRREIKNAEKRTTKQLEALAEDMAGLFHETWKKMDETNERVLALENNSENSHHVKN